MSVRIRELGPRANETSAIGLPFEWEFLERMLHVRVPHYARVSIRRGWRWYRIHDGKQWSNDGVLPTDRWLDLKISIPASLRVETHGRRWQVEPILEESKVSGYHLGKRSVIALRYFGGSVLAHLATLSVLVGLLHLAGSRPVHRSRETENRTEKTAQLHRGTGLPAQISEPFSGISYDQFRSRERAAARAADPVGAILGDLKKLRLGDSAPITRQVGPSTGNAELSAVTTGLGTAELSRSEPTLTRELEALPLPKARKAVADTSRAPTEDQSALRETFKGFEGDFKRLYSSLLSSDPDLTATVAYEISVLPTGFLSVTSFQARGKYRPESLEKLRAGMEALIRSTRVETRLAGVRMRGESVFTR